MNNELLENRVFINGAARYFDLIYFITQKKEMIESDVSHSTILAIDRETWCLASSADWNSTAITVAKDPDEKLIVVGEDGQVITYVGGSESSETITPRPTMIRNVKTVDGKAYACGMKREVFKRTGENRWENISAPMSKKSGFECLTGLTENEIYAVGWNGEIWLYDGNKWINEVSPTNLILTSICSSEKKDYYIVGQQGTIIYGKRNKWELFELDSMEDFWDVCEFNNNIYISSMTGIYKLEENGLETINTGLEGVFSYYKLAQADGILWSIGSSNILSFDGVTWKKHL